MRRSRWSQSAPRVSSRARHSAQISPWHSPAGRVGERPARALQTSVREIRQSAGALLHGREGEKGTVYRAGPQFDAFLRTSTMK